MKLYSIMPLDPNHVEEYCRDIKEQYEKGIATDVLMCMTMVPEGNPAIDKAAILCETFDKYQARLAEDGISAGILVQATIGHGYVLDELFPFQQYMGLNDGQPEYICCPYDEAFRSFMRKQFHTLAAHHPREIMVDDDLRLMHRWKQGCACPLHLAEVNRRAGTNLTREQLYAHTQGNSPEDKRITDIFIETQKDSVLGAARAMREGIDEVDPAMQGSFCGAGEALEFATEIAQAVAGKGNPIIVRLNNSNYHPNGAREFTDSMFKAAMQTAVINGRADVILAETDTCPHNRYSTPVMHLHSHMTGSILEGVSGAKHWITRLDCFEPDSGKAYRRVLSKYRGFYETLSAMKSDIQWQGCRIPVSHVPDYGLQKKDVWGLENNGWSCCVLERLGLPMFFSAENGGAAFLHGDTDKLFSDEQMREMLSGTVVLAADTALRLQERGLGQYIGVAVRPWAGPHPSGEYITATGARVTTQKSPMELIPGADTIADSMVYHLVNGKIKQDIFPGCTVYHNSLGGTVIVFCGTPKAAYHYTEGFGFLNETRKKQLISLLTACGCCPAYYVGDEEVYFRTGLLPTGERFCAVFNIGLDPIEEIVLHTEKEPTAVKYLTAAGVWESADFRMEEGNVVIELSAPILTPVMLRLVQG